MGGYGSTRWAYHSKKQTVEHGLTLDFARLVRIGVFDPQNYPNWYSTVIWKNVYTGEETATIAARLHMADQTSGRLLLNYTVTPWRGDPVAIEELITITTTTPNYGGWRYWLHCPHCKRRCGKLYKPHGSHYFLCRLCHGLTYESAQTAHQYDRLGRDLGIDFELLDRLYKAMDRNERKRR